MDGSTKNNDHKACVTVHRFVSCAMVKSSLSTLLRFYVASSVNDGELSKQ